jgi:glycolate oxidase iron-sulfur subunit
MMTSNHGQPSEGLATAANEAPDGQNPGAAINYRRFLECVHCGLCTASCPTYAELGNENDGPRGRIYLMRSVTDGRLELTPEVRQHLELCLDCRACETACPSGVQYGRLIEPFRIAMDKVGEEADKNDDWFRRWILYGLFPNPRRLANFLRPARFAQRTGLMWLAQHLGMMRLLPPRLRQLTAMLPPARRRGRRLPEILPAIGKPRARVALFTGCVADVFFRPTHWATARVLQQNGCDVLVPRTQQCCGAIHLHSGASELARRLADANVEAFKIDEYDAVIVNVAGCGAMLKDYGHHWQDEKTAEREQFVAKVKDVHEFLAELGPVTPHGEINLTATYHDACHLVHAQKIREAPRKLLSLIPGLTVRDLPESELCCGAAGTYNLTQPEMAQRLARRKLQNIQSTGASAVITANAGCILQIAREARAQGQKLPVYHPMDLLDASYRGKKPRR